MSALVACGNEEFAPQVTDTGEGCRLWWTDYVANEWDEMFPDLAAAVARARPPRRRRSRRPRPPGGPSSWRPAWSAFADLNLSPPL